MVSMTGFGKAQMKVGAAWLKVEISSVNRRQLEVLVGLPKELVRLERLVREWVGEIAKRGRIQVFVEFAGSENLLKGKLDRDLAVHYEKLFRRLVKDLKLANNINLQDILMAPGVLNGQLPNEIAQVETYLEAAVKKALKAWQHSRGLEGKHLKEDFLKRVIILKKWREKILSRAKQVPKLYRERLKSRLEQSGLALSWEDDVLRKELLFFAERCDITEELTRLESHLKQVEMTLKKESDVGRKTEFLLQEIFREVNTIGSKANDVEITQAVVELKMEVEKMREQVQNIE